MKKKFVTFNYFFLLILSDQSILMSHWGEKRREGCIIVACLSSYPFLLNLLSWMNFFASLIGIAKPIPIFEMLLSGL